jgi:hypothetical protein
MAENLPLAQVLAGISGLKTKEDLYAVLKEVKDRLEKLKVERASERAPNRFLTEEEIVDLAKGNSEDTIRVNKEKYDYSKVKKRDLVNAMRKSGSRPRHPLIRHRKNIICTVSGMWP